MGKTKILQWGGELMKTNYYITYYQVNDLQDHTYLLIVQLSIVIILDNN